MTRATAADKKFTHRDPAVSRISASLNHRENAVIVVFVPASQANEATRPTFHLRTKGEPSATVEPVTKTVEAAESQAGGRRTT